MEPQPTINVAAVGDLHMREQARGSYKDYFARISAEADVLALCGDLTNLGLPEEAHWLAEDLRACTIPVVAVLGNHDFHSGHEAEVRAILSEAGVVILDGTMHVAKGIAFVGACGFGGGFDRHMLSAFGEPETKRFVEAATNEEMKLENALHEVENGQRIVAVLHYSPVAATVQGEPPEIFPFLGCSRLAEAIDRFPVSVAFHGHAHHGTYAGATPKGTPVYNCAHHIMERDFPDRPFALVGV